MLHCIDEEKDLDYVLTKGIYQLAQDIKAQGIIRHLGFSTHNPAIAHKLLELGGFDLFMFSLKLPPSYDGGFSWTRKRLSDEMKLTSLVN